MLATNTTINTGLAPSPASVGPAPPLWDGAGSPPGYSYIHANVFKKSAGNLAAFISGPHPDGTFKASGHDNSNSNHNSPFVINKLPTQTHTTPQAAHAYAETYLNGGAPKLNGGAPKSGFPPAGKTEPSPAGLSAPSGLPAADAPLRAWDGTGVPSGFTSAGSSSVGDQHFKKALGKKTALLSKMANGRYLAQGTDKLKNSLFLTAHATPQEAHAAALAHLGLGPAPAASGPEAPAAVPEAKYVTLPKNGALTKTPLTDTPLKPADVENAKDVYGLTPKAHTTLQAAVASGKLKTQGDLAQTLAMTHAVNKGSGYSHLTGFSLDKALAHGSVAKMKAAAEAAGAGSEAATHAAALEDTNILSPASQKAADQDAAFKSMSGDELMHKKVGAQAGSNPGGFYKTKKGDDVYAKRYADAQQAHSEHAANAIYNALGISAPASAVAKTKDGKTVYASKLIPNTGTLGSQGITKAHAQEALKGHAADLLLANHDVAGQGLDNMVMGEGGKVSRIDNGGALLYRAQGAKKPAAETGSLGAWDGLSDPAKNPDYAKLFKSAGYKGAAAIPGMTSHIEDIQKLEAKHGGWDNFLKTHAPGMDDATRQQAAAMLTKRTQLLGAKRQEMLETQGGSLDTLAGKTSVTGGASKQSSGWGKSPFAAYAQKVDALGYGKETQDHFGKLYQDHPHVFAGLTSPISKWTGSSSGHAWQDQWPAALDGKTHAGALKVQEALQTRRDRWQKLSDTHGVPFPETFHLHRGTADKDGTVLPHIISAWRSEDEPYMMAKAHPASSWSLSKDAAKGFYGHSSGALYETHVPFEQTLADKYVDDQSFLHSFSHEHEVVVGGHKDGVIVPKSGVTAKYKGTEYSYGDRQKLFDEWAKDHGGQLPDPKHFGIDIAAHQKKVGAKVQLGETGRQGTEGAAMPDKVVMPDDEVDYKNMTGAEYMAHINAKVKAFQAPLIEAGVTPAPPDGTVKPLGSFAEARAEMAEEKAGGKK